MPYNYRRREASNGNGCFNRILPCHLKVRKCLAQIQAKKRKREKLVDLHLGVNLSVFASPILQNNHRFLYYYYSLLFSYIINNGRGKNCWIIDTGLVWSPSDAAVSRNANKDPRLLLLLLFKSPPTWNPITIRRRKSRYHEWVPKEPRRRKRRRRKKESLEQIPKKHVGKRNPVVQWKAPNRERKEKPGRFSQYWHLLQRKTWLVVEGFHFPHSRTEQGRVHIEKKTS